MIRSLRTGITGLRSNQLALDVIGNNIAGVNTIGFKRSRVLFEDALAQRLGTGSRLTGSSSSGVSNVGNGVTVASVDQIWSQGAFEYTNLPTDLAIAGDGFFLASSPRGNVLTRAGAFSFDSEGYLTSPAGLRIQGWQASDDGTIRTGALEDIRIDPSRTANPARTDQMSITGNLSADRDIDVPADPDFEPLTMSSVIYDGTGIAHTAVLEVAKTAAGEWTVTKASIAGDDSAVPPVPETVLTVTGGPMTFDADGNQTGGGSVTLGGTFPDGSALDIDVDLSEITQFGGSSTATVASQNGSSSGDLIDYGFDRDGQLVLAFSNGVRTPAAQIAVGIVQNPDGLEQVGDGYYDTTSISGDVQVGRAGAEIRTGIVSGALESSNVDLAQEFTDMIVAQRGYQANARVVTTSDELLQETVSLKR
ncbi:flagellar hook protein FlgE [Rubrivirga sp.]|uniref:flagellar hook protein FlgE n=1 Tax=Rubrivirga sp. TaxID=1885344 RepID=UPI003C732A94